MDPISIAMGLAQFVPQITNWLTGGNEKAEAVAQKAVDIAKTITGKSTGDEALSAMQADSALAIRYKTAVLAEEAEFARLSVENAADINETMRAEAASEHKPTYMWRPMIGFAFAFNMAVAGVSVAVCYIYKMLGGQADVLALLPQMLTQLGIVNAGALPILGIASYFRGKMQADPNVPTDNRG